MLSFLKETWTVTKWALVKVETILLVEWLKMTGGRRDLRRVLWAAARERKQLLDSLGR